MLQASLKQQLSFILKPVNKKRRNIVAINITPIPAFHDNYLWLLEHEREAIVVDPGDANAVIAYLQANDLTLSAILITHHHQDHIGGVATLQQEFSVPTYGPDSVYIPQINHPLQDGNTLKLFGTLDILIMAVPGHTKDHIAYFATIDNHPTLFCGDTLFAAGCGRIFDGSCEELRSSLERINQLPENTKIYCTHEYTLSNLTFAAHVEPGNRLINERLAKEQKKRDNNQVTLPSILSLERATNPFLRYQKPEVANAINKYWQSDWRDPDDLFRGLRRWKDNF